MPKINKNIVFTVKTLVSILNEDGASRKDAIKALEADFENPGIILSQAQDAGFINRVVKQNSSYYFINKKNILVYEIIQEQLHNEVCIKQRDFWTLDSLFYKDYEAVKEVIRNKNSFIGLKIRGKKITGIGTRAITLKESYESSPEFHNFLNERCFMMNKNSLPDGVELSHEILQKYGKDTFHIKYINLED